MIVIFRGRDSILATSVAARSVLDISSVTRIYHEDNFPWQAQYLVMLEGDPSCSVHCT